MLSKYQSNFASLTQEEASLVAHHMARVTGEVYDPTIDGPTLYDRLSTAQFSQAQVILAVAPDPSPEAVVVLEKLVGRPIKRELPQEPAAQRKPRAPSAPRGAARRGNDPRVVATVAPNPKKPSSASWARYELYRVGMTVDEFVAAGGTTADVKWDLEKGFITLAEPEKEV